MSKPVYWAGKPASEIAAEIEGQFTTYQAWLAKTGYLKRIRASYNAFYGVGVDGSIELEQSDDGAITKIAVNHYKNLVQHLHILTTQNKISFVPRARNSDSKSQIECDLARGLLDYYGDEKGMNTTFSESVLMALVAQESFVHSPWNEMAGEELVADVEAGEIFSQGDQDFEVLSPLDVARSTTQKKSGWYILRVKRNKYDLAAQHSKRQDAILSAAVNGDYDFINFKQQFEHDEEDMVDVFILYHAKTPAMREGREVWVCGGEVLKDRPLLYKRPPVGRLSAGDVLGQVYGESPSITLLPAQEAINALFSAVTTNNLNLAVQNVWSPDPNLRIEALADGQNLIHSAQAPQALQLTQSSPETYKLIESLINQQQLLSGVNNATRGAGASSASGSSLALQLATAVQFATSLQASYAQMASDVGTCVINNLQTFASSDMIAVIGGVSKKSYVRSFKSEDIMNVDRVSVDLGDAISQSLAGRYELFQQFLQYGTVKDPERLITFLRTGQLESETEDKFKDSLTIREENEMLKRGEMPAAVITDNHPQHIAEHKTVFSDPDARKDPAILKNAILHMQEHGVLWGDLFRLYPAIAAALNMPPPPMGTPAEPQPDQSPGVGSPPEDTQEVTPEVAGVNLPNLPANTPPGLQQAYEQQAQSITANPLMK